MQASLATSSTNKVVDRNNFMPNVVEWYKTAGKDLFQRTHKCSDETRMCMKFHLHPYFKTSLQAPLTEGKGYDYGLNHFEGANFASQDYMGLSTHKSNVEEYINVVKEYGTQSGGTAATFGLQPYVHMFAKEMADYLGVADVIVYPTGWMAGYGVTKALLRPWDHVVMDKLTHNCMQEGIRAATPNVHAIEHLNDKAIIEKVKQIREEDPHNAILVVTESLYSMDSDNADLVFLQKECKKYGAFLLFDMAHDLGAIGEIGKGAVETQNLTDLSNVIIMGSGSKILGANIGFVGCSDPKLIDYLRHSSPTYIFSTVTAPSSCAVALNSLRIIRSPEGAEFRKKLMDNSIYLRQKLTESGFKCLGGPSALVPIFVGDELLCRIIWRLLVNKGAILNGVEFPSVPKKMARLRAQLQPNHTKEQLDFLVEKMKESYKEAQEIINNFTHNVQLLDAKPKL